jgi:crotonobetaine/carnitine-CoA ligase
MDPSPLDPRLVLPVLLAQRAQDAARVRFLADIDGDVLTFAECYERVMHFAGMLTGLGVRAGDRVATVLPASTDEQCLWLACGWLRALQVPVNPAYRGHLLRHVLQDSAPAVVIAASRNLSALDEVLDETTAARLIVWDGDGAAGSRWESGPALRQDAQPAGRLAAPEPWDNAAVIYTSGTTGPAKGVLVPWAEIASGVSAFDDFGPGDRLYAPFAPFHLGGKLPVQVLAYWAGTYVFRDGFKTTQFWADVRAHDCNRAWLFHAMAQFLWRQPARPDDADNPLQTVTGGPLMAEYEGFERRFGLRMRTNFGMTELGWPITTGDRVRDHRSCGTAREGYDLRIVDEHDQEMPEGEVGELIIRSDQPWIMNAGYLNRPAETSAAWRNGWFHTGDAFRRDAEGNYFFLDRIRDTIRRRSENIASFDVESFVLAHPDVLECAAVGVPSDFGEEEIKVFAVAVAGRVLPAGELHRWLRERMPSFMVPRYLEFLPELPKTVTSKVRKVELRKLPAGPATWDSEQAS